MPASARSPIDPVPPSVPPAGMTSGAVATLTVNGNVTFAPTAVYKVDATAAGAADKLAVTGTAALGGTVLVTAQSGNWAPSTKATILSAGGSVTGHFASISSNLAFLTPSLTYDANSVTLVMARNTTAFQGVAQTGNQMAVATAINAAPSNSALFLSVVGQSAAGARGLFEAASGEGLTAAATGGLQAGRAFGNALQTRSSVALPGGGAGTPGGDQGGMMNLGARPTQGSEADAALPRVSRLRMWAAAFDENTRTSGEANVGTAAQTSRQSGVVTGVDTRLSPNVVAGVAAGYSEGSASTDARASSVSMTGYHAGVYGMTRLGNFYLSGSAGYAGFDNRSKRTVTGFGAPELETASFVSNVLSARLEVGQEFSLAGTRVTPFFSLEAARYFAGSFQEAGGLAGGAPGTLGLTTQAGRADALPATLGVRVKRDFDLSQGVRLAPSLSLGWVHNFARERTLDAAFTAVPTPVFTVAGARADADLFQARAGLDLRLSAQTVIGAEVGTEQGAHTQSVSAKGDVRITW